MNLFFPATKFSWAIMHHTAYYVVGIAPSIMVGASAAVDVCKYEVGHCYFSNLLFIVIEYIRSIPLQPINISVNNNF